MRTIRTLLVGFAFVAAAGTAHARKAAEGKPQFKAGDPEAFWVWHDAAGWHLRATTPAKKQHGFHGVIRAQGISELKPTAKSLGSKVRLEGSAIRFEFDLYEGADGFDWKQNEPCVALELKIDKQAKVERIFVGAKAESPSAMPFDACQ